MGWLELLFWFLDLCDRVWGLFTGGFFSFRGESVLMLGILRGFFGVLRLS